MNWKLHLGVSFNRVANDILTICWTSGTTGTPKGVPRSHNLWVTMAKAAYHLADTQKGDILLNPFPLVNMASIGGFLFNWLICKGKLIPVSYTHLTLPTSDLV